MENCTGRSAEIASYQGIISADLLSLHYGDVTAGKGSAYHCLFGDHCDHSRFNRYDFVSRLHDMYDLAVVYSQKPCHPTLLTVSDPGRILLFWEFLELSFRPGYFFEAIAGSISVANLDCTMVGECSLTADRHEISSLRCPPGRGRILDPGIDLGVS